MSKSWLMSYFHTDFLSFALQLLHRWSHPALCNLGVLSTYCLLSSILDWGRNSPILTSCCRKGAFQSPGSWPLADILGFPKQSTFTKLLAAENLSEDSVCPQLTLTSSVTAVFVMLSVMKTLSQRCLRHPQVKKSWLSMGVRRFFCLLNDSMFSLYNLVLK